MLIFIFLAYYSFLRKENQSSQQRSKFNFMINQNQITLLNPNIYLTNVNEIQSNWYYVHFLINNLSNVTQFIPIKTTDMILKNTFLLFLSTKQLLMISNISLVKRIDPVDKFKDSIENLSNATYLLIQGSKNYILEQNSKLFSIKNKLDDHSYLIKIAKNSIRNKRYLIELLSENPKVRSITIYHKPVLKNNLMAGYTQKNTQQFKKDDESGLYYTERYLNDKGLNGEGQIVTMVDTYIDFNHAMFYDPDSEFDVKIPLNHRKFVFYNFNGTVEELKEKILNKEHGTHVAATIAGDTQNCENDDRSLKIFNGIASKAKLIYFKLNSYTIDLEIETMNRFNSKISSNSWDYMGFDDDGNFRFSSAAANHPEIIFIFAAGNEYQGGNFTIDDPSGSKNTLAVGSIDDFYNEKHSMRFQCVDDPSVFLDADEIQMYDPFLKGRVGTDINKSDIVIVNVDEESDCDIFENDRLFLTYTNSEEKAAWVKQCYLYYSKGVFVTYDIEKVNSILEHSKSSLFSVFDNTQINISQPVQHAYFSSGGPGNKGIIKPDVMAPGRRIFSAKSTSNSPGFHGCRENGTSDVTIKEGTSQATPNVAGAAALILQYFENGNWSLKSGNFSVVLDGSAIRALLINSCVHPHGSKTPDVLFGHGVVDLSTLLPFDGEFGLQITDQKVKPTIGQNSHQVASLNVTSNRKKLQITLSYLDAVLQANSPILLAHDLDLVVVSPSGKIFKGDNIENGDTQHLSTNEKVIVNENEIELGEYKIHVYTGSFIDSEINGKTTQDFSVVATGGIENNYLTFSEAENCGCDECNPNNPLHCKCDDNSIGPICQGHISIQKGENFSVNLKAHEIKRILLAEKNFFYKMNPIVNVSVDAIGDVGLASVWIDKKCHLQLGEFESNIGTFQYDSNLNTEIDYKKSRMCIAIFNNNYDDSSFSIVVTKKNNTKYAFIGIGCFAAVLLIIIITIACVKSRRNRERNGFTEIKSLN